MVVRSGVSIAIAPGRLATAVARALDAAGAPEPASVGLILTDDAEITELNERHMAHAGPTDVLSFPLLPPEAFPARHRALDPIPAMRIASAPLPAGPAHPGTSRGFGFVVPPGRRLHLGDILVSVERAIAQATSGQGGQTGDVRWSPARELRLLVTHGALHLCAWDHADSIDEATMRALERRLLAEGRSAAD